MTELCQVDDVIDPVSCNESIVYVCTGSVTHIWVATGIIYGQYSYGELEACKETGICVMTSLGGLWVRVRVRPTWLLVTAKRP